MRRIRMVVSVVAVLVCSVLGTHSASASLPGVGSTQLVEGFALKLSSVQWAREAGVADYVAAKGNVFLLVSIEIKRQGGHGTYLADPSDFHIEVPTGDVLDTEALGITGEFKARHVYSNPVRGIVGFEVPAKMAGLKLLWQPTLDSNPDAQAEWQLGTAGKIVQSVQ